ncbi:MAG TPA: VOC family protein, partial [Chloroflexota bacterium]|nr:VOC family protein [Chloroflexota bacterium]
MKPTPPGWPRISSTLFYEDAPRAIDWLCEAFGFEVRLKIEADDGKIEHSELTFGEGLIMVGDVSRAVARERKTAEASPRMINGVNTQSLCVVVDDADAHCAHARASGATILQEPTTTDYGADYWVDR